MKIQITIDSYENTKHFSGKLPAARDGFCKIKRTVKDSTITIDENDEYSTTVKIQNQNVKIVTFDTDSDWTFDSIAN